jgi:transcription elongation factor Elf1
VTEHAPACEHVEGCITCGDEAVLMTVLKVDDARGLALCADADDRKESVEIALVAPVATGDELLVHAATAIARAA